MTFSGLSFISRALSFLPNVVAPFDILWVEVRICHVQVRLGSVRSVRIGATRCDD